MPDYFEQGFMVREPAWHGMGVVLDDYPGREEGMRLAGHDFEIVETPIYVDGNRAEGWKALVKSVPEEIREEDPSHGSILNVTKESYGVVPNRVGWDIVDAMVGEGARYETGITLKGGAVCSVLAWLDEPVTIVGDDSPILPWVNVAWTHDGSGAVTSRATSIRTVCWNTQSAAEAQGKRLATDFTFRHSKNVLANIEDAKMALQGVRDSHATYVKIASELAAMPITEDQRDLFVANFLPLPPEALISDRVMANVEAGREKLRSLFDGPTVPEAHEFTAYGLHLAGVEYLDHLRGWKSRESYFGRSMLRSEPAKTKLNKLIREIARA